MGKAFVYIFVCVVICLCPPLGFLLLLLIER